MKKNSHETKRNRSEEMLVFIGKAMDSSNDAIGLSDSQSHHVYHNKAFTDLFEYTPDELETLGGGLAIYADPDIAREVFNAIIIGKSWRGETEMISKSGRKFPVNLRADSIKDENGKIIGLIGVHTDITEQKKVEEKLRESEANYKQLFDNSPAGIYQIDYKSGRFLKANDVFCDYAGCSQEEIYSLSPYDILTEESKKLFLERVEKISQGIKVPEIVKFEILNKKISISIFNCTLKIFTMQKVMWLPPMLLHMTSPSARERRNCSGKAKKNIVFWQIT